MRRLIFSVTIVIILDSCQDTVESTPQINSSSHLPIAEAFINAFYSFDPFVLEATLSEAKESVSSIVYYQGWAEGGNYKIVNRQPCELGNSNVVSCSITVEDDPMLALGIDFHVTDTFEISFTDNKITAVKTSSNDLQVYHDARNWVLKELSELVEKPCQGFFDGGPTPGDCARAMAEGYTQFAASDDFPQL